MSAVTKAIKYSALLAIAGLTMYGLTRLMKQKAADTGWADTEEYTEEYRAEEPREPGDYRTIYGL